MPLYKVTYTLKYAGDCHLVSKRVRADNAKTACKLAADAEHAASGKHAFQPKAVKPGSKGGADDAR